VKGGSAFDIERDFLLAEMAAKGQLNRHSCHDAPQTVEGRAAHTVIGVRQRADGVGNAALGQFGVKGRCRKSEAVIIL